MDPYGVPEEIRTPGPRLRRPLLYPTELQVHIIIFFFIKMVSHTGIEPVTPWLKVKCSTDWANGSYYGVIDGTWTRDNQCHKLALYQLNYDHHKYAIYLILNTQNKNGAGDEGRTRDIQLGRLTLYQLSYSRNLIKICQSSSGENRIRTCEGENQQIYSLPSLAAWVSPLRINK